jgi:hypothetical protein
LDRLPISIVKRFRPIDQTLQIGKNPSILFLKNGQVKKLIVNGFLYDVEADKDKMIHALQEIN